MRQTRRNVFLGPRCSEARSKASTEKRKVAKLDTRREATRLAYLADSTNRHLLCRCLPNVGRSTRILSHLEALTKAASVQCMRAASGRNGKLVGSRVDRLLTLGSSLSALLPLSVSLQAHRLYPHTSPVWQLLLKYTLKMVSPQLPGACQNCETKNGYKQSISSPSLQWKLDMHQSFTR